MDYAQGGGLHGTPKKTTFLTKFCDEYNIIYIHTLKTTIFKKERKKEKTNKQKKKQTKTKTKTKNKKKKGELTFQNGAYKTNFHLTSFQFR